MRRRYAVLVIIAAVATFAVVQDRSTADGARRYAAQVRAAAAGQAPAAGVDEIMEPAIAEGVWRGALWGGAVLVIGLAVAVGAGRRTSRPG